MKKILLCIDAINPDKNALDFAAYLCRLANSKLVGVFLENVVAEEKPVVKQMEGIAYVDWEVDEKSSEHVSKVQLTEENIKLFKQGCVSRGVSCSVHRDRGVPAHEIIEESRFADLVVADAETSFNKVFEGVPTEFMKEILKKAECPVVVAPESFDAVDELIFTYNGSASSVFAIKQFTYLFPQYSNKKVTVLHADKSGAWRDREKHKFTEWLSDHYNSFQFELQKGETEIALFDYVFRKKNVFIVMGSYGRNALSTFFKRSHADLLIKTITQPIFIAHF